MEQDLPDDNSALLDAIVEFLGSEQRDAQDEVRAELARELDAAGPEALRSLGAALTRDTGWDYYPGDPLARRIHRRLAERFLTADSGLAGAAHARAVGAVPVAIFANHLSYSDANVIDVALQRAGVAALAERLTALAGPKVFTSRQRRFSSLCFGTIKVPQSTEVSSDEAVLNAREVARAARRALEVARERLAAGDALLLFGEGTRSRSGGMQPLLAGVARYLDAPDTWILPAGITGSEALYAIGQAAPRPARVTVQLGPPFPAAQLLALAGQNRRRIVDTIGLAIAELLPPAYRGVYGDTSRLSEAAETFAALHRPAPV